ncbi:zinc-dependent alcohol dehydrogenase [Paenibacillus cellulositrophicus]|uniref:zinc-dependent alcohol dehydrogenase n=1 Tax=Paenibacillus cellulositrophicus TaxID=562959 RepID=UPI0012673A0A|nr:zinc-binding alcohol dehydrogenase [Paenibacillus cellulositrophicus]
MKAVAALRGSIVVTDTEDPPLERGHVRIRTEYSAISPGTELSFLKKGGDHPSLLGYSAAGIVEEIGEGVNGLLPGQRVACYGAPYVRHAERLTVPSNLVAAVPDHVLPEEAAFAGLGAIAIHALRTADLRFGESAVVVGLGILGQIIAQIASAAAVRVAALDLNAQRVLMLQEQGIRHAYNRHEQLEEQLQILTDGHGADSVILCAGGPGEELINRSLTWIRDRGNIVVVGDLTTTFSRGQMFGKEAQVLISRAGGPGRYDSGYEKDNRDYPIGYVRWTEGRNVAEYVRLLAEGRISVLPLISHRYPLGEAEAAYANYLNPTDCLGTILEYES